MKVALVIISRKTEIINMNIERAQNCSIEESVINQSEKFKYLGTYLAKDGSLKLEFEEMLEYAHQVMGILQNIWDDSNFSTHTSLWLV